MITSFKEIHKLISGFEPIRLAVVNPRSNYIIKALKQAEDQGWIKTLSFVNDNATKAVNESIAAVRKGDADLLMKGNVDTATLLKAVMHRENGLRSNKYLTHVAAIESPNYDRLILTTDGGVNPTLNDTIIDSIIENAVRFEIEDARGQKRPEILGRAKHGFVNLRVVVDRVANTQWFFCRAIAENQLRGQDIV